MRTRFSFDPDQQWQENQLARLYRGSGGGISYLGDWHSHPGGRAKLSSQDRKVGRLIATAPSARCPHPVILIFGTSPTHIESAAFLLMRVRYRGLQIKVTSDASADLIF